jgi:hypothetical protein
MDYKKLVYSYIHSFSHDLSNRVREVICWTGSISYVFDIYREQANQSKL